MLPASNWRLLPGSSCQTVTDRYSQLARPMRQLPGAGKSGEKHDTMGFSHTLPTRWGCGRSRSKLAGASCFRFETVDRKGAPAGTRPCPCIQSRSQSRTGSPPPRSPPPGPPHKPTLTATREQAGGRPGKRGSLARGGGTEPSGGLCMWSAWPPYRDSAWTHSGESGLGHQG